MDSKKKGQERMQSNGYNPEKVSGSRIFFCFFISFSPSGRYAHAMRVILLTIIIIYYPKFSIFLQADKKQI